VFFPDKISKILHGYYSTLFFLYHIFSETYLFADA